MRALLPLLLAVCACDREPEPAPVLNETALHASACQPVRFEGAAFTVCRYDPREHRVALALEDARGPFRNFAELERHLGTETARLRFAMNAGMFDAAGMPIGLYVEDGRQVRALNRRAGSGNFHMAPNGVFVVDDEGRPAVMTSQAYARDRPAPRFATQSGPMLLIDGAIHPDFDSNGMSLHIRNGVGVGPDGAAWFAISEEPVSFGRFARMFRFALRCRDALYLDGAVSSLWDRPANRQDAHPALGPMVLVFDR